ncbi:MAG: hypothetical protein ABSG51_16000 [Terracidiphilus sp.]|jgi:bisphosphoglycerate-independent phosphoglycerate mutase (AlkP superfamily)
MPIRRTLVLTILDQWGYHAEGANNAIAMARKPAYDKLLREYPNMLIRTSEHFVGPPRVIDGSRILPGRCAFTFFFHKHRTQERGY